MEGADPPRGWGHGPDAENREGSPGVYRVWWWATSAACLPRSYRPPGTGVLPELYDGIDAHARNFHGEAPREIVWKLVSASLSPMYLTIRFENLSFEKSTAIQFKGFGQSEDIQ